MSRYDDQRPPRSTWPLKDDASSTELGITPLADLEPRHKLKQTHQPQVALDKRNKIEVPTLSV